MCLLFCLFIDTHKTKKQTIVCLFCVPLQRVFLGRGTKIGHWLVFARKKSDSKNVIEDGKWFHFSATSYHHAWLEWTITIKMMCSSHLAINIMIGRRLGWFGSSSRMMPDPDTSRLFIVYHAQFQKTVSGISNAVVAEGSWTSSTATAQHAVNRPCRVSTKTYITEWEQKQFQHHW